MVREAHARARGHHNTAFCQADAEALPFRHGACDLVASKLAFHYFSQPQVALAEMTHVATHEAHVDLMIPLDFFGVGLGLLIFFAEQLIKGVVGTSMGVGLSPFLLSVIFIGFDRDNLAVGTAASAEGMAGIALGSVLGGAMVAIALAFGISALVAPMTFAQIPRKS
jgi:cation:H+ antiporter